MPARNDQHFYDPIAARAQPDQEVLKCDKCGCKWLELILLQQFPKDHNVILGQKPPTKNDVGFWIFKCPKCNEMYEPRVINAGIKDPVKKEYDAFFDLMMKTDEPEGESL